MRFFILFACTAFAVILLDILWIGYIAKPLYHESLGFLLRKTDTRLTPIWAAAGIVYLCIVIGILFFALPKAGNSYLMAFIWGALLGVVIYGVYDFTNLALIANWPLRISLLDFGWGIIICSVSTCIALLVRNSLFF